MSCVVLVLFVQVVNEIFESLQSSPIFYCYQYNVISNSHNSGLFMSSSMFLKCLPRPTDIIRGVGVEGAKSHE